MTGSGMRPLCLPCGEQGKLLPPKKFILPERDTKMSEQQKPKSFMEELDLWTDANVIGPLETNDPKLHEEWTSVVEQVKKAIRTKVLESYRNGQAVGPRQPRQPQKGGR